jgi:hypothetical protein
MVMGRRYRGRVGYVMVDLVVAMALIGMLVVPSVISLGREGVLARKCYQRAVADAVVDGEFEVLQAGGWKRYGPGRQAHVTRAEAVASLPKGGFWLTLGEGRLRLEWIPERDGAVGTVVREGRLP